MRKKLLALVLALAMVLSMMVVPVSAEDADIPDDAVSYGGHYYKIYTDSVTWTEAEARCEALGGYLATITSADEQAFIDEYNSSSKRLWIGGYREDDNTVWMWVTGETWDYTNWGDGEPNNSSNVVSNENRTVLWSGGYWNDLNDDNTSESAGYICEWGDAETDSGSDDGTTDIPDDAVSYDGHYYKIYTDSVTWTEAEAQCEALGGYLATITSADEQAFIDEYNSSSKHLWVGGYREDDNTVWMWVTGETWDYTNWGDGEPNNSSNVVSNENRTVLWSGGYWNDLNDDNTSESAGYICEWGDTEYWIFGEDNFCFTNSYSAFGRGSIYIEDEMFYAYLDTLNNTQISKMALEYGSFSFWEGTSGLLNYGATNELYYRIANFICNNLKNWGGACYGMSLVATLIKVGNLSAEDLGAATTYELPALKSGDNTTLESIINLYHISQMTAKVYSSDDYKFSDVMETMWNIAVSIGDDEQPYLVYLNSSDGDNGHTVVCYGAETGDFSTGSLWWKEGYTKRLLIYDPKSDEEEYIYISDDFNSAETTCDDSIFDDYEFEVFGIHCGASGNTFVETMDIDHNIYLDVDNMTVSQYTVYSSDGSYAEISNGTVVGGTLDANIVWPTSVLADGEEVEAENEIYTVYLPDDAEYYRIVPAEGETLDALMTFDDFSINVSGTMESATIYADGTVEVTGAEGDLSIDVTLNNSEFDFVGIAGSADGDVTVYVSDESITVTGDLTDYVVENMNRDCETDGVSVEDDTDIKVTMENETVVAYADLDGDGEYETEISDNDATNPFTDVNTGHYFYNAVLWAVDNGITSGTTETTFSPFLTAERCQVVTFLWRAAGCPEPTSTENPFTDVNEGDYFYTAVLWAVENGITTGTSATTFSPYATCERCQVVTFLYRYFDEPEVTTTSNPFTDVDTDDYFYNAVLWAVDNGITTGTSDTTFGPFVTCERCMVVTFLYRALGE